MGSKKPLKDKQEDCELFLGLHSGQCFLKELNSEITRVDLANLRNPFVEGGLRRYLHRLLPKHHTALLMKWDVAL